MESSERPFRPGHVRQSDDKARGVRRILTIFLVYAVMTLVMTYPLINLTALGSASYQGDARLIIWTLAWDNHALLSGLPLFQSNMFYPAADSLAYNEHLVGLGLFTLPIYAATHNAVLAYNVVWLLSFVLNGVAAHALLKRYTQSDLAALTGSMVYTFSFYKMLHAHGHLHLVWTWLVPVSLLCLERWYERPTLRRAIVWGVAVVLQALTSWYLAVMVVIAQSAAVLGLTPLLWRQRKLRDVWHLLFVTVVAAAIVWPFARVYRDLAPASRREVAANSADTPAYLIPPQDTWAGQLWLSHVGRGPRWIWGERTLFVGWIALGFSALGLGSLVRRNHWRLVFVYGGLTVVAIALSFGPSVTPAGESWSAFGALSSIPGMGGFRAPARFALLVLLGISVLTAFGAARLQHRGARGTLALSVLFPLMLSEWFVVRFPSGKPQPFPVPAIYKVAALSTARALVSLPQYRATRDWFLGADYLYFSTAHWRPIVNGFGRAEPPGYPRLVSHMNAFPGPNNARTMRTTGIDYIVLHSSRYPDGASAILKDAVTNDEYDLVARIGADYLFRVRPTAR
jgi:hypothetical protein